jgi:hypothetical protein
MENSLSILLGKNPGPIKRGILFKQTPAALLHTEIKTINVRSLF